jgi:hypothetical protein
MKAEKHEERHAHFNVGRSDHDEVEEDPRVRVEGSPTRCPYCHDGVSGQQPTVVCEQCLSRHHAPCWVEACASCGATERMVRDPAHRVMEFGAPLLAALRHTVGPAAVVLWFVTVLAVPLGLAAAFGLPLSALIHGVARVRVTLLDEYWSANPPYWYHGNQCPPEGFAGALLLLFLPALLGLSSVAVMARSRGAPRRFALAAFGLFAATLLLPSWALLSGTPFDPMAVGQQREILGWLLGTLSVPAVCAAATGLSAAGSHLFARRTVGRQEK